MTKISDSLVENVRKKEKKDFLTNLFLLIIVGLLAVVFLLFNFVFFVVTIEQDSMQNTFFDGETVIAVRSSKLDYGDIVVFEHDDSANGKILVIKRVIALEGDVLKIDADSLSVYLKKKGENEFSLLEESYIKIPNSTYARGQTEWTLNENEIFCMGDNRTVSKDCRDYGPVSKSNVLGVVSNSAVKNKKVTTKLFGWLAKTAEE